MKYQKTNISFILIKVIATVGCFSLIGQLYLILANRKLSILETVIQYFSYFTILSNLLVTICCISLIKKDLKLINFFSKSTTLTAVTVYITVVGLVYNAILRFLWAPEGLQKLIDELLHTVIPLLFTIYWLLFVPKNFLKWKNVYAWLIFPFIYCIYILCRGAVTRLYPYPFINVVTLGYKTVYTNICFLVLAFLLIGLSFIAIAKLLSKNYLKTSGLH